MRCPRCGNENPDQNRFCGMCGNTMLAAPEAPTSQPPRAAAAATPAPAKEVPATRAQVSEPPRHTPVPDDTPSISGPSFLGLNDPPPRKRASLSVDPHSGTSRNLDYLLEDEEEKHKSSGAGKFLLFVIALALAAGLGYLRWKGHVPSFLSSTTKPSAASQPASDADSSSPNSSSAVQPGAAPSQPPANTSAPSTAAAPVPTTPTPTSPTPTQSTTTQPAIDSGKPVDTTGPEANPDRPASAIPKDSPTAAKPPAASSTDVPEASDAAKPAAAQPAPKPPAARPAPPVDPVAEAQKYLYGRGVPQDCDRGMRYLKPAANQGNPKAMVEMGALYSAGLCTPHDLPTAYRWFAMALRKDPDNQSVQSDLQKLWGEMTQPERQLAIRLTQ